jgi:hypothetical protein
MAASPIRLLRYRYLTAGIAACFLLAGTAAPARAEPVPINLQAASPADAARALQHLLGAPVEVRGGEGGKVTLRLPANVSPTKALDRVAQQLGGSWRMKLRVKSGKPENPRPSPLIDRSLAVGLQDITAARAFTLVARDLNAELELEGDLEERIGVIAVNVTATVVLDRIAEQAGATWDVVYVIDAPNAPQPVVVLPSKPEPEPDPSPVPVPEPMAPPAPRIPTAIELRNQLKAGIQLVVRTEPSRRAEVVREFIQQTEALIVLVQSLPPALRAERLRVLASAVTPWRRLYQGLAPDVRTELAPVSAVLGKIVP